MTERSKSVGSSPQPTGSCPQAHPSVHICTTFSGHFGSFQDECSSYESHDTGGGVKESNEETKKSGGERVNEDKAEKMETENVIAPGETLVDLFRRALSLSLFPNSLPLLSSLQSTITPHGPNHPYSTYVLSHMTLVEGLTLKGIALAEVDSSRNAGGH